MAVNLAPTFLREGPVLSLEKGCFSVCARLQPGKDAQKAQGHPSCTYQDLEMLPRKGVREDAEGEMIPFTKSMEQSSCGAAEEQQKAGSPSAGLTAMANQRNTVTKHSQHPRHQSKCYNYKNIALNSLKTSLAGCTINPKKSAREKQIG